MKEKYAIIEETTGVIWEGEYNDIIKMWNDDFYVGDLMFVKIISKKSR